MEVVGKLEGGWSVKAERLSFLSDRRSSPVSETVMEDHLEPPREGSVRTQAWVW